MTDLFKKKLWKMQQTNFSQRHVFFLYHTIHVYSCDVFGFGWHGRFHGTSGASPSSFRLASCRVIAVAVAIGSRGSHDFSSSAWVKWVK